MTQKPPSSTPKFPDSPAAEPTASPAEFTTSAAAYDQQRHLPPPIPPDLSLEPAPAAPSRMPASGDEPAFRSYSLQAEPEPAPAVAPAPPPAADPAPSVAPQPNPSPPPTSAQDPVAAAAPEPAAFVLAFPAAAAPEPTASGPAFPELAAAPDLHPQTATHPDPALSTPAFPTASNPTHPDPASGVGAASPAPDQQPQRRRTGQRQKRSAATDQHSAELISNTAILVLLLGAVGLAVTITAGVGGFAALVALGLRKRARQEFDLARGQLLGEKYLDWGIRLSLLNLGISLTIVPAVFYWVFTQRA